MNREAIARIKLLHRPTVAIRACSVVTACTCGATVYPCPVMVGAFSPTSTTPRTGSARGSAR